MKPKRRKEVENVVIAGINLGGIAFFFAGPLAGIIVLVALVALDWAGNEIYVRRPLRRAKRQRRLREALREIDAELLSSPD